MTLTLRVLAPDQSVFDGPVDEVILPSATGQLGVLTGHVSLLTALDSGVLRVREGSNWSSIALMGGFAEVEANEVTVLVNAAEVVAALEALPGISVTVTDFQRISFDHQVSLH
jgi:F-type H+-transporting ATPase subunit epsilon